jgi:predicted TIM-barrel fold metal-dependent hydrolase
MHRCVAQGHRGVLFANAPEKAGMPRMRDHHWDPIYSTAQDMGIAINFHVGFGVTPAPQERRPGRPTMFDVESERADRRADFVKSTTLGLMSNSTAIVDLCLSGLLERFPRLNFVSVESGFGYVPYLLETMDWQWLNTGASRSYPERMMPSEYFRRQVYATFWFEHESLCKLVTDLQDNVMFESDFPHPTCLAPGPASYTDSPKNVIESNLSSLPEDVLRKLLYTNAARVYGLEEVKPVAAQ